jgi:glycerol kinase
LAGMQAGIYPDQVEFAKTWACETQFTPLMDEILRTEKYAAWGRAVHATMGV